VKNEIDKLMSSFQGGRIGKEARTGDAERERETKSFYQVNKKTRVNESGGEHPMRKHEQAETFTRPTSGNSTR